jgi:hypothetical protein
MEKGIIKNRESMRRILILCSTIFIMFGCAAQKKISETKNTSKDYSRGNYSGQERDALDAFIDGSVAEAKGDYASAIVNYTEALI